MRFIRYFVLAVIALALIGLALANRDYVTLRLMPEGLAELIRYPEAGNTIRVPLFVVLFGGIVIGVLLGFVAEWIREHRYRAEAARKRREAEKLKREVEKMKSTAAKGDDVLALLEDGTAAR